MGISQIVGDAVGGFNNIVGLFTGGSMPYPDDKNVTNDFSGGMKERSWKQSKGYSFRVVRVLKRQVTKAPGWEDFRLQINPQELSQDEIFAVNVTPTFGGVTVEHQGVTLKDIMISGTTGISPNRRGGGAFPQTGAPIAAAGHSGYREFHMLRNYFKVYVEKKRIDKDRSQGELRMIWTNLRDHEALYVEPQKFIMRRSSSKPFLYDYQIQLKAIGKAEVKTLGGYMDALEMTDDYITEVIDGMNTASKMIDGYVDYAERTNRDVTSLIISPLKAYANTLNSIRYGYERLERVAKQTALKAQVRSLLNSSNEDIAMTKKNVERTQSELMALRASLRKDLLEKSLGQRIDEAIFSAASSGIKAAGDVTTAANKALVESIFNAERDAMSILSDLDRIRINEMNTLTLNYQSQKLNKAIALGDMALTKMLATNVLFETSQVDTAREYYNDLANSAASNSEASANLKQRQDLEAKIALANATNDPTGAAAYKKQLNDLQTSEIQKYGSKPVKAIDKMTRASTKVLQAGETIQTVAAKYLGDPDAYKSIILLNGLAPPYVEQATLADPSKRIVGVLYPGDTFLIPNSGGSEVSTNVTESGVKSTIGSSLSNIEKGFGIDLMLDDSGDLAISNTGDIKLIGGISNVSQGIGVKLLLEQGSLKRHLDIGTNLEVGVRGLGNDDDSIDALLNNVRSSLESDGRIDAVIYAAIDREGSSFILNLILRLRQVDHPVSLPLRIA